MTHCSGQIEVRLSELQLETLSVQHPLLGLLAGNLWYFCQTTLTLQLLSQVMMGDCSNAGKQLAYLSLETPGGALKASSEQEGLGEHTLGALGSTCTVGAFVHTMSPHELPSLPG